MLARRAFFSKLSVGLAAGGAVGAAGVSAQAPSGDGSRWQAARHAQDDWLDQIPGAHRFIFDTTSPQGAGSALLFANNFFLANQAGYGLGNADAAVVIVVRHNSTPFAYSDAMWAKYGGPIGDAAGGFDDPKTKARPAINVYLRRVTPGAAEQWRHGDRWSRAGCTSPSARWRRAGSRGRLRRRRANTDAI
jgi:hypothetical protein